MAEKEVKKSEEEIKGPIMGYSVKAKKMVEIQNPKIVTLKNGRKAVVGTCPITGAKVYRFIGGKKEK